MSFWRHFSLVLVFLAIAGLEIQHGHANLENLRREKRRDLADIVRRHHLEEVGAMRARLARGKEHVRYLSGIPSVSRFCDDRWRSPEANQHVHELVLSFLAAYEGVVAVSILDSRGIERFRGVRDGESLGAIARDQLRFDPDLETLSHMQGLDSPIELHGLREEPAGQLGPARGRQLLRYLGRVATSTEASGVIDLTVDASRWLESVRRLEPIHGVRTYLVDQDGRFLAHPEHDREQGEPSESTLLAVHPGAAAKLMSGVESLEVGQDLFLSLKVCDAPAWRIVTWVPASAFDPVEQRMRRELIWTVGSSMVFTLALAVWAFIFLRLSVREFRLSQEQRYLAQIARESEKYRALMEGAADMILILDPGRGVTRECNLVARRVLQIEGDGTLQAGAGLALSEICDEASLADLERGLELALSEGGRPVAIPEISLRRRDGGTVAVDGMLAAIDLGDESVVEASLRDLTDKKKMERQLMIADRLSMVGRMTAGVAHEINNPLEGIANYLALLERDSTPPEKRRKYLENVRHGFHLIRDIVRDLSAIARPEPEQEAGDLRSRRADLTQVVAHATAISAHASEMKSVEVVTAGLDHPLVVAGDERRLEQVFLNLFLNAGRAMGGAGRITVTATAVSADGAGDLIEVAVEDEGTGIPEGNLTKIFDPFFTTAHGGGMGLFVSYGIVRAHGGDLVAENRAPRGARFLLRLPAMIEDEVQ